MEGRESVMGCIEAKHENTPFTIQRALDRIMPIPESGCWIWLGSCAQSGYAHVKIDHKTRYIHRIIYEHFKGPISPGLTIDHLCRVRCCINPDHLEQVTRGQNVLRGESTSAKNRRKTHCIHGHELCGANLVHVKSRPRTRVCRICTQARLKISNQKQKEARLCIARAAHS